MATETYILLTILACSLVTWLERVTPVILLKHFRLPKLLLEFLNFVPIAIMSGLWFESLLIRHAGGLPTINWLNLWSSIPALLAAILSKDLLVTVIVGVVSSALLQLL